MPDFGSVRADDESWGRRRAQYERWLADEGSFALLARRDGRAIGYAFVRTEGNGDERASGREAFYLARVAFEDLSGLHGVPQDSRFLPGMTRPAALAVAAAGVARAWTLRTHDRLRTTDAEKVRARLTARASHAI